MNIKRKCQIVLLPTKNKSNIQLQMNEKLHLENGSSISLKSYQHLYITSDEEIKEGDWCYNSKRKSIELGKYMIGTNEFIFCKKIIATTDISLISINEQYFDVNKSRKSAVLEQKTLPQIPQEFIEAYVKAYNEGNPITEVMVEYELDVCKRCNGKGTEIVAILGECNCLKCKGKGILSDNINLKVNPDNTINIKSIKDNWSREEVKQLCKLAFKYHCDNSRTTSLPDKWIEENL